MPKVDQATYEGRKERVFLTLRRYPLGLTEAELEQITDIGRRTLNNYLRALETEGKIYKDGIVWAALPYDQVQLRKFDLSPEEAMTLYLAARLLVKQHDKRNEPAETALMKLATVLTADAGVGHEIHQATLELSRRPDDSGYSRIFRVMVQGYIYRRVLRITYEPSNGRPFETDFAPYLLEPSAIGFTTYAIGHSSIVNAWRTYKLERIREAALTRQEYAIPADFPGLEVLRSAWSIIYGEDLVTVRLRFSPAVRQRVLETRWHPSQEEPIDDPERPGYLLWTAQVADTLDMLPWVKGWGADVEVLAPEDLWERLVNETRRLALLYQVGNVAPPPVYQSLWAKADRMTGKTHPLICHMLDVAYVALALWREALTASARAHLARALGLDQEGAGRVIAFWAGLHDLGKASPAFQRKLPAAEADLVTAGLAFPKVFARESFSHGAASAYLLPDLLRTQTALPARLARGLARCVGGHHGAWPIPNELQQLGTVQLGDENWDAVRRDLVRALAEHLNPPQVQHIPSSIDEANALWALLSGFVSVADWIGSMEESFGYSDATVDLGQYRERSEQRARDAVNRLNWTARAPARQRLSFTDMFQVQTPRPMQAQAVELAERLDRPALVIIEAPTGEGKTEAALYLADHWARTLQQRGLYVAMPTMATSNQMYGRVQAVVGRCYPETQISPLLVHSQAAWTPASAPPELNVVDDSAEHGENSTEPMTWFLPRKRSLLAPFGVGTVDQALLSVLQVRHFFVRLLGLSHKTVIFDEVHAYDTYMSTLFQRLLAWLRLSGTSVVILSATLPARARRELLQAYAGDEADMPAVPYPCVTWAMEGQTGAVPLEATQTRTLGLQWIGRAPQAIAERLEAELREGGCGAVICNTVGRAQEVYQAVRTAAIVADEDLILFHARFPLGWRDAIEKEVLARFGKDGRRPHKAIVVATQVIEQSLDLDFDVMISDLAPVDLLIQRAGRLQRHAREARPAPLYEPRLIIAAGRSDGDAGILEGSEGDVYEAYLLLRSYLALQGRSSLRLPEDTVTLIEGVYGDEAMPAGAWESALARSRQEMEVHQAEASYQARLKLIPSPQADNLLSKSNLGLAEDSPDLHAAFQALTRLGPPSISLVCLHRVDGKLRTQLDGSGVKIDLDQMPDAALTQALVQASVSVSLRGIVGHYRGQEAPAGWQKHALLKRYYVAIFEEGVCALEGSRYRLRLTRELGLEVLRCGKETI
jgi:CRISPR-associated endonuclease/helicase Cas3